MPIKWNSPIVSLAGRAEKAKTLCLLLIEFLLS